MIKQFILLGLSASVLASSIAFDQDFDFARIDSDIEIGNDSLLKSTAGSSQDIMNLDSIFDHHGHRGHHDNNNDLVKAANGKGSDKKDKKKEKKHRKPADSSSSDNDRHSRRTIPLRRPPVVVVSPASNRSTEPVMRQQEVNLNVSGRHSRTVRRGKEEEEDDEEYSGINSAVRDSEGVLVYDGPVFRKPLIRHG